MTIRQELYSGVPVITPSPADHKAMHKSCSRLDRCFLPGHGKDYHQLRAHLRVIAGCRLRREDPQLLTEQQFVDCIAACPEPARFGCSCDLVVHNVCSAFVREVADARNILVSNHCVHLLMCGVCVVCVRVCVHVCVCVCVCVCVFVCVCVCVCV
jgi:hypothetical protein